MKEGFRQTMAWLHTWLGLIVGWVLFYVYLTGTLGYLDKEIDYWMTPEKKFFAEAPPLHEQLAMAQQRLTTVAPNAQTWNIQLIGGREAPWLEVKWTQPPEMPGKRGTTTLETLNPQTGEAFDNTARATGGGQLLYRMHYSLAYMPLNTAILIVMICTMIMFAGMITGIIAHKNIFKDFFTFRPGKGQRSWLDAHNLLSVGSLPFHLVVTYSGLLFFVFLVVPAVPPVVFKNEAGLTPQQQVYQGAPSVTASIPASAGHAAPLVDLSSLLAIADQHWGANKVTAVEVRNPGDTNARVIFKPLPDASVVIPTNGLLFDGGSGNLLADFVDTYAFGPTDQILKGIHRGVFAGPFLRALYMFMGLAGTTMIGSGLLLWSNKRKTKLLARKQPLHTGIVLVDMLNLGTIVGLPIAIAAYFWANRLLPVTLATRSAWEVHVMYLSLLACFLYPLFRPLHKAWVELLWLAAAITALLPVVNALTTQRHLGISLAQGDWVMAGFDLTALATGVVFAVFAFRLQRKGDSAALSTDEEPSNVAELAVS